MTGLHFPTHVHERRFLLQKKERVVLRLPLLVMHNAADKCVFDDAGADRFL